MKHSYFALLAFFMIQVVDASKIQQEHATWQNWSQSQTCNPQCIWYPETKEDLQAIIQNAKQNHYKVKAIGSGHTMNDMPCTDGYLVRTDKLDKILEIDFAHNRVRVEAGKKLKHFFRELADYGLALSNQGFITDQSIAGALATGTHGSGHTGILSDYIYSIELIDGNGNYHIISPESNPEWLPFARLHLGGLGIVYALTIECEPLFILEHTKKTITWNEFTQHYKKYFFDNDFCMVMGHPEKESVLLYVWNKTEKKESQDLFTVIKERILKNRLVDRVAVHIAHNYPFLASCCFDYYFGIAAHKQQYQQSYKSLSPFTDLISIAHFKEAEVAVPIDLFPQAFNTMRTLIKTYANKSIQFVGTITARLVKGSDRCALSPTYNRDSIFISINTLNYFERSDQFYHEFYAVMEQFDARPHWAKTNFLNKQVIDQLYGERAQAFNELRQKLDPDNIFANDFITRCFG